MVFDVAMGSGTAARLWENVLIFFLFQQRQRLQILIERTNVRRGDVLDWLLMKLK